MRERRMFEGEARAAGADGEMIIEGTAAVFNQETELAPGRFEVIRPGAFKRSLDHHADVRCLFNHDENLVLARTRSGSLELWEDEIALHYRAKLDPNDPDSERVFSKIKRGDVSQSSFYFQVDGEGKGGERFHKREGGGMLRELLALKLYDVSPVTFPAYETTEVEARSAFRNAPDELDIIEDANASDGDADIAKTEIGEAASPEPAFHLRARNRQKLSELLTRL